MHHLTLSFLIFLIPNICFAGVEKELFLKQYDSCTVRITHDATPDSKTGVLIFRSYKVSNGLHQPCDIDQEIAFNSFKDGFKIYLSSPDLKPITSIFIGRLIRYPWARHVLKTNPISKTDHQGFNKIILGTSIITPFENAVNDFDYKITNVSCEKMLYDKYNFAIDGLCWLILDH